MKKKGISLIVLVITIIVMIILASTVVISLSNTNIINKAGEAVDEYNEQQNDILSMLEWADNYLEGYEEQPSRVIYSSRITGTDGTINMPVKLDDPSKIYVAKVESAAYTGEVVLNTYSFDENFYIGSAVFANKKSIPLELIHYKVMAQASNEDSSTSTTTSTIATTVDVYEEETTESAVETAMKNMFGGTDVTGIAYISENGNAVISYEKEDIGSEVTITEIREISRKYEGFAKLVVNLFNNGKLTSTDFAETLRYTINTGNLGYEYLNDLELDGTSSSDTTLPITFNESKEMATMRNVLNNRIQVVKDVEHLLIIQTFMSTLIGVETLGLPLYDVYSAANYFEENDLLNEYATRSMADAGVVFAVEYTDLIVRDLNEDGVLGGTYKCNVTDNMLYMPDKDMAGYLYRSYAALAATLYPVIEKYEDGFETMSYIDQQKFLEAYMYAIDYNGSGSGEVGNAMYMGYVWALGASVYSNKKMDTFFTMIYDTGNKINSAGLKMGWNSIITPEFLKEIQLNVAGVDLSYDLRQDRDALSRQGVTSIADELYECVDLLLNPPVEEDTSTDTGTDTSTDTGTDTTTE